jgi:hypothetical protein
MSNLQSTVIVSPQTDSIDKRSLLAKAAIILMAASMIAALLVCLSIQGAPAIDLSNLVAP